RAVRLRGVRARSRGRSGRDAARVRREAALVERAAGGRRHHPRRGPQGLRRHARREVPGEGGAPGLLRAGETRRRDRRVPPRRGAGVEAVIPPVPAAQVPRVGIFADAALQPRWVLEAIGRAAASGCATVVWVLTPQRESGEQAPVLWRAYCRADQALFGSGSDWSAARD